MEDPEFLRRTARVRLRVAWQYRDELKPYLPEHPHFHAHAWSALYVLEQPASARASIAGEPNDNALEALLQLLLLIRGAVEVQTRPGDVARESLLFGTKLRATAALVAQGKAIVSGARSLQARFPALSNDLLEETEQAIKRAQTQVGEAEAINEDSTIARILGADRLQLALDVLLDSLDQLRAAAMICFRTTRPKLAEALSAPVDRRRPRGKGKQEGEGEGEEGKEGDAGEGEGEGGSDETDGQPEEGKDGEGKNSNETGKGEAKGGGKDAGKK